MTRSAKLPSLTTEEVAALVDTMRTSPDPVEADRARNTLFDRNVPLVYLIAKRFHPRGVADADDVAQLGKIGLWRAIDGFDPALGFKFSTFATRYISNEISREARDWPRIKAGRRTVEKIKLGIAPETADQRYRTAQAMRALESVFELDKPNAVTEQSGADIIPASSDVESAGISSEFAAWLSDEVAVVLATVSPTARERWLLAYPMDGSEPLTRTQVAAQQGVSISAVSCSFRQVRDTLRAHFENDLGYDYQTLAA